MFGIYLCIIIGAGYITVQTNKKAKYNQLLLGIEDHPKLFGIFAMLRLGGVNSEGS